MIESNHLINQELSCFSDKNFQHTLAKQIEGSILVEIQFPVGVKIFLLVGPTQIGKTTLCKKLIKKLEEDGISCIYVRAEPSTTSTFRWKPLYKNILRSGNEVLIDKKIEPDEVDKTWSYNRRSTEAALRQSVKNMLKFRDFRLMVIDEAQCLGSGISNPTILETQLDVIKDLVDETHCIVVLCGVYSLLRLIGHNPQIEGRGELLHFRPYDFSLEKDCEDYARLLHQLIKVIPLDTTDLFDNDFFFEFMSKSLGSFGHAKKWLLKAIRAALLSGKKKLTREIMMENQLDEAFYLDFKHEIDEGEKWLALWRRKNARNNGKEKRSDKKSDSKKKGKKPGKRNPRNYPVEEAPTTPDPDDHSADLEGNLTVGDLSDEEEADKAADQTDVSSDNADGANHDE